MTGVILLITGCIVIIKAAAYPYFDFILELIGVLLIAGGMTLLAEVVM